MSLVLTDPQGKSYMVQAPTQEEENANADGMLQVKIIENEQTKEFIDKIGELWTVTNVTGENDKREYVVVLVEPERWKDKMTVTLTARLKHFDYLATHRVYEDVSGSRTNIHYFETIFADTPFSFTFLDHADAVEWENAGQGADKLSMFLRGVERYGYEWRYEYHAKQFILGKNLNRRPAYYFSKKLNANNVKIETDATEFYTYVRGFGDFEDDAGYTTAKLTMDYPAGAKSPMIDLFGIREAEPVMDGRISKASTMERYMQDRVDPSLKFSIEFDFVSLMEQYPYAQPEIYDIVPFIDNKLEIQQEMKVVGISTKRDAKHKPISKKLTIGDQQLRNRQRKQQAGLTKEINSILHGGGSLPYDVLPRAVKESSELLQGTRSEIGWSENGLLLTDKTNPNYVTLINSSGIGVSNDGGQTFEEAIRRGAINANLITAGALNANYIRGGTLDANLVRVVGGDEGQYTKITDNRLEQRGQYRRKWLGEWYDYDVITTLTKGYIRFGDENRQKAINMSAFGISTYLDGDGEWADQPGSSGTIAWFDPTYSPTGANGITINSWGGVAALTSFQNRVMVRAGGSVNLESTNSNIYIRPDLDNLGDNTFSFNIADNREYRDGYIMFGGQDTDTYASGLRFSRAFSRLEVVDTTYSTGGDTTIEAGNGAFNTVARRDGNQYLNIVHPQLLKVGSDGQDRVASEAIYNRTYSGSANVYVTNYGTLGRSTSASKYKLSVENQFKTEEAQLEHSKNILNLDVRHWFDKEESEITAKECEVDGFCSADAFKLNRHVGLIAEEVESAGLNEHVVRNEKDEVEGIEYDRLWVHLLPIIKQQQKQIEQLEAKVYGTEQ